MCTSLLATVCTYRLQSSRDSNWLTVGSHEAWLDTARGYAHLGVHFQLLDTLLQVHRVGGGKLDKVRGVEGDPAAGGAHALIDCIQAGHTSHIALQLA